MEKKLNFSSLYRLRDKPRGARPVKAAQQAHVIEAPSPNATSGPCRFWLHIQRLCKQMTSRSEPDLLKSLKTTGKSSIP